MNDVTIFITTFKGRLSWLQDLIEGIELYADVPYNLIVVDNASNDGTYEFLKNRNNINIIRNEENLDCCIGSNQVLQIADTPYIISLDTDTLIFDRGWLKASLDFMNAHPEVGIAGDIWSPGWPRSFSGTLLSRLNQKWLNNLSTEEKNSLDHVQGGYLVLKKEMIDQIGLFDERFRHEYMDVEYSFRALSFGWKLGKLPFVHSIHTFGEMDVREGVSVYHPVRDITLRHIARQKRSDDSAKIGGII